MSVYVSTTYLGDGSSIRNAAGQLKRIGIKNIELGSNHAKTPQKEISRFFRDKHATYIAHNYFPAQEPDFVLNIASQNNKVRDQTLKFIQNTIKLCQNLNIKFYTIHPGFLGDVTVLRNREDLRNFDFKFVKNKSSINRKSVVKETVQIIKNIYRFANKQNVQLLIENEGSKTSPEFVIFDSHEELDLLKKEIGESLKFNFNLAHATLAGINLKDTKTFRHFYKNSPFFEVSEIQNNLDSHLPITSKGTIGAILKKYSWYFARKNVVLEYRNININEVHLSYKYVNKLLHPRTPKVQ